MVVHEVCAGEQLLKVVEPDVERDGHADGGPQGIPAAHPVPEFEHVALVDAEVAHLGRVGRQRHEVLGDGGGVLGRLQEPVLCRVGVSDGLLRGEGLAGDDEQRRLRIQLLEGLRHVGAVDVGHEVDVGAHLVRLQGLCHHVRALI